MSPPKLVANSLPTTSSSCWPTAWRAHRSQGQQSSKESEEESRIRKAYTIGIRKCKPGAHSNEERPCLQTAPPVQKQPHILHRPGTAHTVHWGLSQLWHRVPAPLGFLLLILLPLAQQSLRCSLLLLFDQLLGGEEILQPGYYGRQGGLYLLRGLRD